MKLPHLWYSEIVSFSISQCFNHPICFIISKSFGVNVGSEWIEFSIFSNSDYDKSSISSASQYWFSSSLYPIIPPDPITVKGALIPPGGALEDIESFADDSLTEFYVFFIFSFFQSNLWNPIILKRLTRTVDLIIKSKFVSQLKLGERFISINQGFRFSSSIMSYPNNSKQLLLWGTDLLNALTICFSPEIRLFKITS